jgi:hypothetical protein
MAAADSTSTKALVLGLEFFLLSTGNPAETAEKPSHWPFNVPSQDARLLGSSSGRGEARSHRAVYNSRPLGRPGVEQRRDET